ncbi:hypothetical protein BHE74_00017883 [Ensete ventricosum]|nr:hypothetical protein BHE74_00017883 [Ensete ventricosum]RZS10645.1 hypothetical protein BHM03_00041898 [Ensete ventricosum]
MNPATLVLLIAALCTDSLSAEALPHRIPHITVLGAIDCKFVTNSTSREEMSITADRTTDRFGVYKLEIPPVDGFECREGREIKSMCRASLSKSSSLRCNVAGFRSSTAHVAVKDRESNVCYFNLNALSYRPARRNVPRCGAKETAMSSFATCSLIFWPILPPFGIPWPSLPFPFSPLPFLIPPSLPFPFPHISLPDPSSLPFPIPSWLLPFLKPPYFPFPFPPIPFLTPTPTPPYSSGFPPPALVPSSKP